LIGILNVVLLIWKIEEEDAQEQSSKGSGRRFCRVALSTRRVPALVHSLACFRSKRGVSRTPERSHPITSHCIKSSRTSAFAGRQQQLFDGKKTGTFHQCSYLLEEHSRPKLAPEQWSSPELRIFKLSRTLKFELF
jgi:hypothetical protein